MTKVRDQGTGRTKDIVTQGNGNDQDGVKLPEITVPLATYTGWNLRETEWDEAMK